MTAPLDIAKVAGRSVVIGALAHSPLVLLNPRNHGHSAWVYQSSHGGGFVGGDEVALTVSVERGATLFLSSQASSKAYRATRAKVTLDVTVAAGATLVSWPDPVSCFTGASLSQRQSFSLEEGASLLAVDAYSAGRVARGERWAFERFDSRIHLDIAGVPTLRDAVLLSAEHGDLPARMSGAEAFATIIAAGPGVAPVVEALRAAPGASTWPWGLVLRLAAPSVERLTDRLRELLQPHVAALLGDDPWARKS
jgi:urease accessory protein